MNDNELDQLLKNWASRMEGERPRAPRPHAPRPVVPSSRRPHILSFITGAAAALAAVLAVLLLRAPRADRQFAQLLKEESRLASQRHASMVKIFNETERLFGPNLQWVADTQTTAELGLSETPSDAAPLVLRVTVVRRDASGEWSRLWGMEVVARGDGTLEMEEPRLSLSLRALDGRQAFVESRLALANGVTLSAQSREILRFGESKSVGCFFEDGSEYRVLQTVEPAGEG